MGEIDSVAVFEQTLNDLYCSCFPLRVKYISIKRLQKPWLTPFILKAIKTKAQYFKLYKLGLVSEYDNKKYKNKLTNVIRCAKRNCFRNRFENWKHDLRDTWKNIKK